MACDTHASPTVQLLLKAAVAVGAGGLHAYFGRRLAGLSLEELAAGDIAGARDVLSSLTDDDVSNDAFPFGRVKTVHVAGAPVMALRITYVGELGYELHIPVEFAASVNPIPSHYQGSFWKAARRACIIYDWLGHGHNVQKRIGINSLHAPCKHCGQHDDQAHIMLLCTNPLLSPIRIEARKHQEAIANKLQKESKSNIERHFIEQFTLASWISSSPTTARIWTGMWTRDILTALFPPTHDMLSPMGKSDRYRYRRIVRLLMHPLTCAYKKMICIGTSGSVSPTPTATTRPYISSKTKQSTSLIINVTNFPSPIIRKIFMYHLKLAKLRSHTLTPFLD
jgi:hypothetical protein